MQKVLPQLSYLPSPQMYHFKAVTSHFLFPHAHGHFIMQNTSSLISKPFKVFKSSITIQKGNFKISSETQEIS